MRLYHGSAEIVARPEFGKGKHTNDYGQGFYCTCHRELACEWACPARRDGFVNAYDIDFSGLSVLDLNGPQFGILHWLQVLVSNRPVRLESPLQVRGLAWIKEHFAVDLSGCDIIRGYRADDSYFGFVRSFLENGISLAQLSGAMRLGDLGEQIVLKSRRAFSSLRFAGSEVAHWEEYHLKRIARDSRARRSFKADEASGDAADGVFMMDLLRGKMEPGDERLR